MTPEQIAWVAGIVEGEGCFTMRRWSAVLSVIMTDFDVVRRLRHVTKLGRLYGPYPRKEKNYKPSLRWSVGNRVELREVTRLLLPWLGARRAAAARQVLAFIQEHPPRAERTHCKNGHAYTKENVCIRVRNGRQVRVCRACQRVAWRRMYAKNKIKYGHKEEQRTRALLGTAAKGLKIGRAVGVKEYKVRESAIYRSLKPFTPPKAWALTTPQLCVRENRQNPTGLKKVGGG